MNGCIYLFILCSLSGTEVRGQPGFSPCIMWPLRIEHRWSDWPVSAPNCWAISPAFHHSYQKVFPHNYPKIVFSFPSNESTLFTLWLFPGVLTFCLYLKLNPAFEVLPRWFHKWEMFVFCFTLSFLSMVSKDFPGAVAPGSDGSGKSSHTDVFAEIDIRTSGLEATI